MARCPVRAAADRRRPPDGRPMAGSIFSNIVGSSNLGIDAAWEAARMAGLEDDIKAMPRVCTPWSRRGRRPSREAEAAHPDREGHRPPAAHHPLRRGHERPRQPHPGDRQPQPRRPESHADRHHPPPERHPERSYPRTWHLIPPGLPYGRRETPARRSRSTVSARQLPAGDAVRQRVDATSTHCCSPNSYVQGRSVSRRAIHPTIPEIGVGNSCPKRLLGLSKELLEGLTTRERRVWGEIGRFGEDKVIHGS